MNAAGTAAATHAAAAMNDMNAAATYATGTMLP